MPYTLFVVDINSYGFAVLSAWGTFRGDNWNTYCSGLIHHMADMTQWRLGNDDIGDDYYYGTHDLEPYYFKDVDGSVVNCTYEFFRIDDLQDLPGVSL